MDSDITYYEIPPTYQEFLENHLIPNKPALIGPALTQDWIARKEWIVPVSDELESGSNLPKFKPNYAYLREHFGKAEGQVAKCNKRYFTDQERIPMTFSDFVDLWEQDDGKESVYYLKDLHLVRLFPNDIAYTVPTLFEDDWLNEYYLEKSDDDYRFTYLGGHGTFTPFHADVYRSYSWSSNICGVKKWTFFPPGQEELFKDKLGNIIYDIREVDPSQFPGLEKAHRIEIYQRDGETVFVPSGWFHQVENIGATISINHNWSNACNLLSVYQSLHHDLNDVQIAIEDVKKTMDDTEFIDQCQQLLLVHSGWDWRTFLNILYTVVKHRSDGHSKTYQPSLSWQLDRIGSVLEKWETDEGKELIDYFKRHDLFKTYMELKSTISTLRVTL
ncbi:hypothetical protein BD560DRAFT_338441 [Blakeslea trispora]|nr:hypothetical protein BD560DRAFT_338441 [Blakeslea trispora]